MKSNRRELRNDATGVTWAISSRSGWLTIEIVTDGDPEPVIRERMMRVANENETLIAEQLADGFIERVAPTWSPDATWIRNASDQDLSEEIIDPWLRAVYGAPAILDRIPEPVADYVAVYTLIVQTLRNGLPSFFTEEDPRLVQRFAASARRMGRDELADPFERATANMDLAVQRRLGDHLPWTDRGAMRTLAQRVGATNEASLVGWVRAHAEAFSSRT